MTTKIKVNKNNGYTVMSNHHLRNKKMTLKSKGLMSFMLSLPSDWDFTEMGLVSVLKEGREAVRSSLKELERFGYLVREKKIREEGKFGGYDYTLYETPHRVRFTDTVEPLTVEPTSENQTQISTDLIITDKQLLINSKPYSPFEAFELFWSIYPRKDKKKSARDKFIKTVNENPNVAERIINDVENRCRSKDWIKDKGKWVPHAITYLNQERWEDGIVGVEKDTNTGVEYS